MGPTGRDRDRERGSAGALEDVAGRVRRQIRGMREALVDLTCRLVAVPTENPPGRAYRECASLLAEELDIRGLDHDLVELSGDGPEAPGPALLTATGSAPILYLHGHYDVVPASREGQFEPRIEGDRIVGRGAADMKGAVAAMICALSALSGEGLDGRVGLVLVPDEEAGGRLGTQRLLRSGRLRRDAVGALLGEPTSGVVWNGCRGAVTLRVKIDGKGAHVGLQHAGRNAFEGAIPVLSALAALKAGVETRQTTLAVDPPEARGSILMLGGEVGGGAQFNVVPDRFTFTVERRFNPEEDLEIEERRLLETIEAACPEGVDLTVEVIQRGASCSTEETAILSGGLSAAVAEVTGERPRLELCPGLLETRRYAEIGVPALAYGPGLLSVSHGPEEAVEIERLVEAAEIYALTAIRLFGPGGR